MTQFIKSAFFMCLVMLLVSLGMAVIGYIYSIGIEQFFACMAIVMLMILPSCSTKK